MSGFKFQYVCADCVLGEPVPHEITFPTETLTQDAYYEVMRIFERFESHQLVDAGTDHVVRHRTSALQVLGVLEDEDVSWLEWLLDRIEEVFYVCHKSHGRVPKRQKQLYIQLMEVNSRNIIRKDIMARKRTTAEESGEGLKKNIDKLLIPVSLSTLAVDQKDCVICSATFGEVSDGAVELPCKLPCGHMFGTDCIRKALKHKRNCPMCRVELTLPLGKEWPRAWWLDVLQGHDRWTSLDNLRRTGAQINVAIG